MLANLHTHTHEQVDVIKPIDSSGGSQHSTSTTTRRDRGVAGLAGPMPLLRAVSTAAASVGMPRLGRQLTSWFHQQQKTGSGSSQAVNGVVVADQSLSTGGKSHHVTTVSLYCGSSVMSCVTI